MVYRYGHTPYRYGHPGYRYGIWANDMGDDSIDIVILYIDMGYLLTLLSGIQTQTHVGRVTCAQQTHVVNVSASLLPRL
jgi:hypothetical protein